MLGESSSLAKSIQIVKLSCIMAVTSILDRDETLPQLSGRDVNFSAGVLWGQQLHRVRRPPSGPPPQLLQGL